MQAAGKKYHPQPQSSLPLQVVWVCRQLPHLSEVPLTPRPPAWRSVSPAKPGALLRLRGRCLISLPCSIFWQSGGLCSS